MILDLVQPGMGGMSVACHSPESLPEHRALRHSAAPAWIPPGSLPKRICLPLGSFALRNRQTTEIVAEELRKDPDSRADILADLERIRLGLREEGRSDIEDIVLDVMDFVTGWASPHMRI
jgi:hypothetical protein